MRRPEHRVPAQRTNLPPSMHAAMQVGGTGSKQRAAQACQTGNTQPELCFSSQRSGLKFPVQLAHDWRTFYLTVSSRQTRYCLRAVTAVPKSIPQNLVTTGY